MVWLCGRLVVIWSLFISAVASFHCCVGYCVPLYVTHCQLFITLHTVIKLRLFHQWQMQRKKITFSWRCFLILSALLRHHLRDPLNCVFARGSRGNRRLHHKLKRRHVYGRNWQPVCLGHYLCNVDDYQVRRFHRSFPIITNYGLFWRALALLWW